MNATMTKFGYPGSLVHDYDRWCVLLRPEQATLGALVLACKEPVKAFGEVSPGAFTEMQQVVKDIEGALRSSFAIDKFNYLMLMMVDPDVHFHILPRYASAPEFSGISFADRGWPGPPALAEHTALNEDVQSALLRLLKGNWRSG